MRTITHHFMHNTAELTLAIIEFLQTDPAGLDAAEWTVWPHFVRVNRQALTNILASMPKPAVVAVLAEPHAIFLLPFADTSTSVRARMEHERQNQQGFFAGKYAAMHNTAADSRILFGTPARRLEIPYPIVAQWMSEFLMATPWTILQHTIKDEPPVRFRIRGPDRKWST